MTWSEVCARRLDRHGLAAPFADARPADVVRAMCGAHAQILSAAELSIGLRIADCTRIPPASGLPVDARLTLAQTDEVVAAIAAALADAELTIDELSERVVATTGSWAGDLVMPAFQGMWPRWRQAISAAANRGALCFGPNRGRKVTYTNPHRWLPGFAPADERTALAEIVKRYVFAYGPATPRHFARWLGAPPA
jgi:hypothetical protein